MRFHQLDTLRYFFAALIVLGHSCGWLETVPAGALAVDYFFVLSGFVIAYSLYKTPQSFQYFIASRAARLYPLYLVTLLLCAPPIEWIVHNVTEKNILSNLLLLQGILPIGNLGYNWPAWSVSTEFWMNIFILFWVVKFRAVKLAIVLIVIGYSLLWSRGLVDHAHAQQIYFTTAGLFRCVSGVLLGYLVFLLYKNLHSHPLIEKIGGHYFSLTEVLLAIALVFLINSREVDEKIITLLLMPVIIFVLSFNKGVLSKALGNPKISTVGNLTYGVYLVHVPILVHLRNNNIIPAIDVETPIEIGFLILLASTLISIPVYYLFEVPVKKLLLKPFKKKSV